MQHIRMKIAIMQPYFFPYIGYFQLINAVDKFVIYDDVNYINKGWINRNNIIVNGKAHLFTIPLKEASQNKLIKEIYLSEESKWRVNFLKTIDQNYKKAPFFETVFPFIEEIINCNCNKIAELIVYSLKTLMAYLKIKTELVTSSSIYNVADFKGQERILAICKKENSKIYINPIGGQDIYSKELFDSEGVKLNFLKTSPITYTQYKNEFVPWLSMIDVLMFNSPDQIHSYLNNYQLIKT
jgi:hypothetical protein